MRKSNILHSSLSRFSIGVPVRANLVLAFTDLTALALWVEAFLIYCASSMI